MKPTGMGLALSPCIRAVSGFEKELRMRTNATQAKSAQAQPQLPADTKKAGGDSEKKKASASAPKTDEAVRGNEKAKGDAKSLKGITQGKAAPKNKPEVSGDKPVYDAKSAKEPEKKNFKPLFSSDDRMKALAHGGSKFSGKSWVLNPAKHKDAAPKLRTDAPAQPMARGRVEGSASRAGSVPKREPIVIYGN